MDNSTAVAYVNHKGETRSSELVDLALQLWNWCIQNDLYIIAHHVPRKLNTLAHQEFRISRRDRLDYRSENYPTFPDKLRQGPLCQSAYTTSDDLHATVGDQLRSPLRRFQFVLEKPGGIRLPSFQLNSINSEQGCIRQWGDHSSGSNMANPAQDGPPSQSTSTTTCTSSRTRNTY